MNAEWNAGMYLIVIMAMDASQSNHVKWNSRASLNVHRAGNLSNAGWNNHSSNVRWNSRADLNSRNSHVVISPRDVSSNVGMIIMAAAAVVIVAEVMVAEEDKFRLRQ